MLKLNIFCIGFALWAMVTAGSLALRDARKERQSHNFDAVSAPAPTPVRQAESPAAAKPVWRLSGGTRVRVAVPAFRAITSREVFNAAEGTIQQPKEARPGDVLISFLVSDSPAPITAPPGWHPIRDQADAASTLFTHSYWRLASAGGTDYRWKFGTTTDCNLSILVYSQVDRARPVAISAGAAPGYTASPAAPSLTSPGPNSMLVCLWAIRNSHIPIPPAGLTPRYQAPGVSHSYSLADRVLARPGSAPPALTATASLANQTATQSILLSPAIRQAK